MTTLAYKAPVLAADTQLSDDALMYRVQKIDKLADGSLIGGAGDWDRAYRYMQWLKADNPETPAPKLKGAILLRITPDGVIWLNEGSGFYPLLNKDCVAIGSGSQAAMALMEQGASAIEAIKAVSSLDPNTSVPVQALTLDGSSLTSSSRRRSKSSTPKEARSDTSDQDT